MNRPSPRNNDGDEDFKKHPGCTGQACFWYSAGCMSGCECSGYEKNIVNGGEYMTPAQANCSNPTEPTLPEHARTWNIEGKSKHGDWTKYFPWRAPGSSIALDPCGVFDGFDPPRASSERLHAGAHAHDHPDGSYIPGQHGSKVLKPQAGTAVNWKAGGIAEVSFGFFVNHGGGYQYRLCPKSKAMSEDCFQANVLEFADSTTWLRYEDSSDKADVALSAVDVSEGTLPRGSTWRRVPIPACNCDSGFSCGDGAVPSQNQQYESKPPGGKNTQCSSGVQFEPPTQGAYGYFVSLDPDDFLPKISLVDHLKVPTLGGEFILQCVSIVSRLHRFGTLVQTSPSAVMSFRLRLRHSCDMHSSSGRIMFTASSLFGTRMFSVECVDCWRSRHCLP